MRLLTVPTVLTFALAFLAFSACTTEEGTTPECQNEADCNPFPPVQCENGQTVEVCCGTSPPNVIECEVVLCKYGYGVALTDVERDICLESGAGGSGGGGGNGGAGGN